MILKKDSDNEMDYVSDEDKMRLAFAELLNQQGVDTGVDVNKVLDEKIKEAKHGKDFDNTLDALNYSLKTMEDYIMKEPDYYASNGLSPIGAMKQGLISRDEYIGFLKGNIIKYVIRAQYKGNAAEDLMKARNYIDFYLELITDENQTERPPKYGHYELAKREDIYEKNKELMEKALDGLNNIRDVDCNG